jgi:hypothetical protein
MEATLIFMLSERKKIFVGRRWSIILKWSFKNYGGIMRLESCGLG